MEEGKCLRWKLKIQDGHDWVEMGWPSTRAEMGEMGVPNHFMFTQNMQSLDPGVISPGPIVLMASHGAQYAQPYPGFGGLVLAHFSFQGFRLNMSMTEIFWGLYSKRIRVSLPIHQRTSHVSGSQHNVQYAPVALRSAEKVASFAPDLQLIANHHVGTSWMVHQFL